MTIMIDVLEGSYKLANYEPLRSLLEPCDDCSGTGKNCDACRETGRTLYSLHSGDIAFSGNGPDSRPIMIGVEFKSYDDLITSIQSGRLSGTQLRRMAVDYKLRWLLVYGRIRPCPRTGLLQVYREKIKHDDPPSRFYNSFAGNYTYSSLRRYLSSPSFINLFSFDHVETISEAAHWLTDLYAEWTKPWNSHKSMRVFDNSVTADKSMDAELSRQTRERMSEGRFGAASQSQLGISVLPPDERIQQNIRFACSIPGIGYERAKAIALSFYDAESMMAADVSQWASIEVPTVNGKRSIRLGPKVAERIYRCLHWSKKG